MGKQVYFEGNVVFDSLNQQTIEAMIEKGWIAKKEKLEFVENREHLHLFNKKIPLHKRMQYFRQLNKVRCKCEDCGKELSLHIRPAIKEDGTVNFKEIICVCRTCRTSKLEKQDILVPQFRKNLSDKTLDSETKSDLEKRFNGREMNLLITDIKYMKMRRKEKRMYSLTKISLPPLPKTMRNLEAERRMLQSIGFGSMVEILNLEEKEVRVKIRKFLSYESASKCPCCGKKTEYVAYTIDHIQPKSKGGPNTMENFIGMCKNCNERKGDFTVLEFLQRKHFVALPERILKVAYAEQRRVKTEYQQFKTEVLDYEKNRLKKFTAK